MKKKKAKQKDMGIIFCPDLKTYAKQPSDISKCELVDCPHCDDKMWFSEKKRIVKGLYESTGKEILFACYPCFERIAKQMAKDGLFNMTDFIQVHL